MEREVVSRAVTESARRRGHARLADGMGNPGAATPARHDRMTWYRLLGYFLTGSIGEHPVKNS